MPKILITGAYGLIGSQLQKLLLGHDYTIHTIGRGAAPSQRYGTVKHFQWDIQKQTLDPDALVGVDVIVHLAGAGVADARWTTRRKKELYDSRIDSTRLLCNTLSTTAHQVKTLVAASAVGIYGDCGAETIVESQPAVDTFLGQMVKDWEGAVMQIENLGIRTVCCRIGIVLTAKGGALPSLSRSILGLAGYIPIEPLYCPWIHIDDVCGIMIHALEQPTMQGSYNTTAPMPVQMKELVRAALVAKQSNALLAPIPLSMLKLAIGEMSILLTDSQLCSAQKVLNAGYSFQYDTIDKAMQAIYAKE